MTVPYIFFTFLERCTSKWHVELVKKCLAFIRHKGLTPSPGYLEKHGINVFGLLQFPGHYAFLKPRVAHMVFNLGETVAEATNFCLEGHQKLLENHYELEQCVYEFLVCKCRFGRKKRIPRILKSSFTRFAKFTFANRPSKQTRGKQKLLGTKKKTNKRFQHKKAS